MRASSTWPVLLRLPHPHFPMAQTRHRTAPTWRTHRLPSKSFFLRPIKKPPLLKITYLNPRSSCSVNFSGESIGGRHARSKQTCATAPLAGIPVFSASGSTRDSFALRSEEHTSELLCPTPPARRPASIIFLVSARLGLPAITIWTCLADEIRAAVIR